MAHGEESGQMAATIPDEIPCAMPSWIPSRSPSTMLDTASCVRLLKRSDGELTERLGRARVGDVCISAITESELMFGACRSRFSRQDSAVLEVFLRHVPVLAYPKEAGRHYGEIREAMELLGLPMGGHALLVAAHARSLELTLVTARARALGRVPGMKVEKWG